MSGDKTKVALVTGGTRGIGAAISMRLKKKGYKVIASYASNHEEAKKFHNETEIPTIAFHVGDANECQQAIQHILKEYGHIDILVHNAGITRDSLLQKMTLTQWNEVLETNLHSCFYITQPLLEGMIKKGFGRLIYLSSVNALKGQRGQSNYAASKAAIIGYAKSLAQEVAHKGVTVNVVAPGYIDTDMVRAVSQPILDKIIAQIPAGRLGKSEEIAYCIEFLANEEAGFITGSVLNANGGMY